MHTEQIGPLGAHLFGGSDGRGGGTGPTVVLLHGFGAPGTDLVGLAGELRVPPGTRFVFPEAPHAADVGMPPPFAGRAWWHIDMLRLQLGLAGGQLDSMANEVPEGLEQARQCLLEFLDALDSKIDIGSAPVVLGGFSQGAMLSTDVVLHSDREFAGLLVLSGALINRREWSERLGQRAKLPFFQSHGTADPILPYSLAERLQQLLVTSGWPGQFVSFQGGHGIGHQALVGAGSFLSEVLK